MQFASANNGILAGDNSVSDTINTEHHLEIMKEVEERKLHRMAKVNDLLDMWQRSQNLHATLKKSHIQNKLMASLGSIYDTEMLVNALWLPFQQAGAAAIELSE
jgi:hypothetical protein